MAALTEAMLAVCDWHTHELMKRTTDMAKLPDMALDIYVGWPIAVLSVLRMRESLGLALPGRLDHPLLQRFLGELLPPVPQVEDELLGRTVHRAMRDYPLLKRVIGSTL